MNREQWLADLERRRMEAVAAATDAASVPDLLRSWGLPPKLLGADLDALYPPDTPDVRRLVAGLFRTPVPRGEDSEDQPEEEWDRRAYERAATPDAGAAGDATNETAGAASAATMRRAAALHLLASLGDAVDRRELRAPARHVWARTERDDDARAAWAAVGSDGYSAGLMFTELWGPEFARAFRAVGAVLHIPSELSGTYARRAAEQLDLLALGMHAELAARTVETTGEPVASLDSALGPEARERVAACIGSRAAWASARDRLPGATIAQGAQLVVIDRLVASLRAGRAPLHAIGLPCWGVVAANRSRIRGRLRAAAALDVPVLLDRVVRLDALWARTRAAIRRHSWDWAWREARVGFGFDPDRMVPPRCRMVEPDEERLPPIGPEDEDAVRTFLLLVLGRGAWEDLERWLGGAPGRALGRTFYRCLAQVPDRLADPVGAASDTAPEFSARRYVRLQDHLSDGGMAIYLSSLKSVTARVAALVPGRDLKVRLHRALAPDWDVRAIPLPAHHLPGFLASMATWMPGPPPPASSSSASASSSSSSEDDLPAGIPDA